MDSPSVQKTTTSSGGSSNGSRRRMAAKESQLKARYDRVGIATLDGNRNGIAKAAANHAGGPDAMGLGSKMNDALDHGLGRWAETTKRFQGKWKRERERERERERDRKIERDE